MPSPPLSFSILVLTAAFATLDTNPTAIATPRKSRVKSTVGPKPRTAKRRFAGRLRTGRAPKTDAEVLVSFSGKGSQKLANAPMKVTPAGGRWGGEKANSISRRLNLTEAEYVYLKPKDLAALENQIETEHRPLAELQISKRAYSKHFHLIAVSIALEQAIGELERRQTVLSQIKGKAKNEGGKRRPRHLWRIRQAEAAEAEQAERVKRLQAFKDARPAYVSAVGLALEERRRLANTSEKIHMEGRIAKTALIDIEAQIASLTLNNRNGWRKFQDTLSALFAKMPGLQKLSDWRTNKKIIRAQNRAQFLRIPSWRLSQILGSLYLPLHKTEDLTQTIEDMVRHFADTGIPINRPINSEKALRALPSLKNDIKDGRLALALLLKHIENGGTVRFANISKLDGVLLDLPSHRQSIEMAVHSKTLATYDGSNAEITLNIANLSFAPLWNSNRSEVLSRYNISLAHEASHGAVASAELLPSRFLRTARTEPHGSAPAFSLRTSEPTQSRKTLRQTTQRLAGAIHNYFVYDSVVARVRHSNNRRIIDDLNQTFEQLVQRGLRPKTLLQIVPLIDGLRESPNENQEKTQRQLAKILKKDLYSSLSRFGRRRVKKAFYKASNLRGAADEALAQRVNGGKIDYSLYNELDEGLQSTLEKTILPNIEQYMRRPEVYRDFLSVLESERL